MLAFGLMSHAQIVMSEGGGLCYPQVYTGQKIINSGLIGYGGQVGINYRPDELQFYPGLVISYGRERLPLQESGNNVGAVRFNHLSCLLSEHFIPNYSESHQFVISGGLGFSSFTARGVAPSGNEIKQMAIDSIEGIRKFFPAVSIGLAYSFGDLDGKDFYATVEMNLQYTQLFRGYNTYYITVEEHANIIYHYRAAFTGSVITPCVSLVLHDKIRGHK
jgi:hypothetical protein